MENMSASSAPLDSTSYDGQWATYPGQFFVLALLHRNGIAEMTRVVTRVTILVSSAVEYCATLQGWVWLGWVWLGRVWLGWVKFGSWSTKETPAHSGKNL